MDLHLRIGILLVIVIIASSCLKGQDAKEPIPEYDGVGLHQSSPTQTSVTGEIKHKSFVGGEIIVEARYSVPCAHGRCPVIGNSPLATKVLSSPGPYTLQMEDDLGDVMVIVTYKIPSGGIRIAHTWLNSQESHLTGINLSLDKPYPPLR